MWLSRSFIVESLHYRQPRRPRPLGVKGVAMSEKSESNSPEPDVPDVELLFIECLHLIPEEVKSACRDFYPHCRPDEIEDLCQDIRVFLWKDNFHALSTFEHDSSLKTWLHQVVRRYVWRYLRKQKPDVSLDGVLADFLSHEPNQEEMLIAEEERKALQAIISRLKEPQRQLAELLLRGLSPAEIAQEMKLDPAVVYKRTDRLFKKLRRLGGGT